MKVSDIMNKAVVVEDNISLSNAAQIMSERNIGSLIVIKKNSIIGILTERDILKNINKKNQKISKIMSKNVITVDENESIDNAAITMAENRVKRLPVIANGKLVGIVTATDIIANSESINQNFLIE